MKTLYLDCQMGAAGDMLAGALLELLPDPEGFLTELNGLGIPRVRIQKETAVKCGITGTHVTVTVDGQEEESLDAPGCGAAPLPGQEQAHEHGHPQDAAHPHEHPHGPGHHHHSSLPEISRLLSRLRIPEKVRQDVLAVYGLIAEAESHAHGVAVSEVHFHEVGSLDAVADITAVCLLMDRLSPDEVVVSPVHVGSGQVRCAHGILPVPAPATAYLLQGAPVYGGAVRGELCTPTGAALLKYFASRFGSMPAMTLRATGYGMGKKDFEAANCVRAMIGDAADREDVVLELSCNVDDMTAEAIGFAMDRFYQSGALEVYTSPIGMKKSRPGTLIRVLCRETDKEKLLPLMFRHTSTLGIRETLCRRYVLDRCIHTVSTPLGPVRRKDASGYGVSRSKYEHDDLARLAAETGKSLAEIAALLNG